MEISNQSAILARVLSTFSFSSIDSCFRDSIPPRSVNELRQVICGLLSSFPSSNGVNSRALLVCLLFDVLMMCAGSHLSATVS